MLFRSEHIKSLEIPPPPSRSQSVDIQVWSRPAVGWKKLNTDAALDVVGGVAATGVVVRDDSGSFVTAELRKYNHLTDPGLVELLACRDAIFLARDRGWTHVEIETDCQSVVTAWSKDQMQRSAGSTVVLEMKALVSSFQGFSLVFARRECNKAAHVCAREALSINNLNTVYDVTPGFLVDLVQSDRLSSLK